MCKINLIKCNKTYFILFVVDNKIIASTKFLQVENTWKIRQKLK